MASLCQKRVQREVKEIVNSKDLNEHGVLIEVLDNNLQNLRGYLRGPPSSPYEGAKFQLSINIPDAYPFKPPSVKFTTRVWHPNVSSATGAICLDILKENWAASMTLRTVLLSIQALLTLPEPKDPQDAVVAAQYMKKPELFKKTATFWSQHFGGSTSSLPDKSFLDKIQKMKEMGLDEDFVISSLSCSDWDLDKTIGAVF
ncbi:E2 ubiquitin-conjugating enzyme [Aphelenchoides besseyi]|nr:E2 ubiquitin-conjugating enzyme [Aphelenchoides besseyi]KAI6201877.1 E2 ubiquitin-conjugating enzyme [Aphelenchoides besseyi]